NAEEIARIFKRQTLYAAAAWINDPVKETAVPVITFLVASRLQVCKGAVVLAEALQLLQQEHPGIEVLWIGEDTYTGLEGSLVSKYIRKKFPAIWQKSFTWKKAIPRKELLETIDKSEIIIIPSAWETFNYVALEAANRKKAMIITKQAGVSSLFMAGKEIILTDAGDIHSIAEAMIQLEKNKELVRSLGENAFESLERSFNKQKFLEGRNDAYAIAIEHRKNNPPVNPIQSFFNR
ncbi:MAG: glycosyltransferase, partial [Bacteroidota bacterium]